MSSLLCHVLQLPGCPTVLSQAQSNRAKVPWTETYAAMSQKKPCFLLRGFSQMLCHSNRKLTAPLVCAPALYIGMLRAHRKPSSPRSHGPVKTIIIHSFTDYMAGAGLQISVFEKVVFPSCPLVPRSLFLYESKKDLQEIAMPPSHPSQLCT